MERPSRRTRRRSAEAPNPYSEDVTVYGPEYADDAQAVGFDAYAEPDDEPEWEEDAQPAQEPLLSSDPRKAHQFVEPRLFQSSPVHRYEDFEEPNPTPPRKWPLYLAILTTTLLVLVAINVERSRQDAVQASTAIEINEALVPREVMGTPVGLPTQIPQAYLEEVTAKYEETEELATSPPPLTEPPIIHTPAPTTTPLLKKGMQGDFIKKMQEYLVELNYLTPEQVDGKYDDAMVKAVKEFQEYNNLHPPDGMIGKDTLAELTGTKAVPMPTPTPRLDEPYVWATNNGTYYHSKPECRNMKGATEWPLSQVKGMRKRPCDRCNPPR